MHRAITKLKVKPQKLLIDGNRFNPFKKIPYHCIIEGDGKYLSIAAASVLAKTYRDDFMKKIHRKHKVYGWVTNKGYGTSYHREAIKIHGVTDYHRKSFKLYEEVQYSIDFKD